ncbi:hypothetical protein GTO89_06805 [Heliobacterium gestii]|uniref:THIF-type NAD/FAD binding fold domain-containing protein n=1 Tax=Heliomicrobium gestii TaxID=2699 RepID=A0A845LDP8_HELGE|nr:ThiF family adenylyltransferase [Heliomicrobium gestii]MBM7866467.1 hypothetical protein [Heliomicrobium gestii]MZP42749.1 hypothetical protein [Heliomicrobium gestii]
MGSEEISTNLFKTELIELGFLKIRKNVYQGRVPIKGDINGYYIDVLIDCTDYPLVSPNIQLISINGDAKVYKSVPKNWRHLDEHTDKFPRDSIFTICALHNWYANSSFNARYVYNRILEWLKSNTTSQWKEEEDLPSSRILPKNISDITLYLGYDLVLHVSRQKPRSYSFNEIVHTRYLLKGGGEASLKNYGNKYPIDSIAFLYDGSRNIAQNAKIYKFVMPGEYISKIAMMLLDDEIQRSETLVIFLGKKTFYKSVFQLFNELKKHNIHKKISSKHKNIPLVIVCEGENGKFETIAFLVETETLFEKTDDIKFRMFKTEIFKPISPPIPLNVGILGAGSLGSQIAKILVSKGIKKLLISDYDRLSVSNLGNHELSGYSLGSNKAVDLVRYLRTICCHYTPDVEYRNDDLLTVEEADIVIVVVGSPSSFDQLAFNILRSINKPIIWAWVSEYNILQEIVITSDSTGCLNCYYLLTRSEPELSKIHDLARKEIDKYPKYIVDACGDPHIPSQWEKTVFLASQIVSILNFYCKHKRFPFEYINYFAGRYEIYPTIKNGHVSVHKNCFCNRSK